MKPFNLFALSLLVSLISNAQKINYPNGKIRCEFTYNKGMLNGPYTSYYRNGVKQAEGSFSNNQRKGLWTVWDSTGQKRVERFYRNRLDYDLAGQWDAKGKATKIKKKILLNYSGKDSSDHGYKPFVELKESDILISKRLWRTLTNDNPTNEPLFGGNTLYNTLYKFAINNKDKVYDSDEFNVKTPSGKIDSLGKVKVVAYRIKEDCFYDGIRKVMECRIIGICPVADTNNTQRPLFWLYYPKIRQELANINVPPNIYPNSIHNYENILFDRYFQSVIYKEPNILNKELKDYIKDVDAEKESEKIEIQLMEMEYPFWMK